MPVVNNQKGFLMMEVLVAIVIITIALVAAGGMFIQSTKANSAADEYTVAVSLAQKQMELLKANRVTGTSTTSNDWSTLPQTLLWEGEETNPIVLNNKSYTVATVAESCPQDAANLVQIRVTVSWSNDKSVVITTFFPKVLIP